MISPGEIGSLWKSAAFTNEEITGKDEDEGRDAITTERTEVAAA
jgi:hypothetical protein